MIYHGMRLLGFRSAKAADGESEKEPAEAE